MRDILNQVVLGDCLEVMKQIPDNSVDCIVADPPYGYSFMGKDWDKVIVSVNIWKECLRVLKDGAFAFVMSAPRQDVLSHMIVNLQDAGFITGFTSIYHTYASGFPKASNIGKMVDKKLGIESEKEKEIIQTENTLLEKSKKIIKNKTHTAGMGTGKSFGMLQSEAGQKKTNIIQDVIPTSEQAKSLDGSYGGFQPKPAVEIILVVMKPLSEKTYVNQAMNNKKGITWLGDGRIPYKNENDKESSRYGTQADITGGNLKSPKGIKDKNVLSSETGRFPANLLVSDDVLDDGKDARGGITNYQASSIFKNKLEREKRNEWIEDSGSFSRYFSLDVWFKERLKDLSPAVQKVFPFLIVPKASKSEKNEGLDHKEEHQVNDGRNKLPDNAFQRGKTLRKNTHPTCKPIKLMSYLITIGSREKDIILDPFAGSCTTGVACIGLNRQYIMCEKEKEYFEIGKARLDYAKSQLKLL